MEGRHFIALCARAIYCLLDRSLCRTPADDTDRGILVSIPLRFGQFLGGSIKLTETLLHHRSMVFRFVVRMSLLIVFQTSGYISLRTGTRGADRRDTTCCISIA